MPKCTKLMLIRHAEKPDSQANIGGSERGRSADRNDLTAKGWRRAGALVRLFNPRAARGPSAGTRRSGRDFRRAADGRQSEQAAVAHGRAARSLTRAPVQTQFPLRQEKALIAAALDAAPAVLISWHHDRIARLAAELGVAARHGPTECSTACSC